jgi:nucleoside-diphosphate-sugar epimerase
MSKENRRGKDGLDPMKVGILGLGHMGLPIARSLHQREHEVFSWSRTQSQYPWTHSKYLESIGRHRLDYLVVASGSARPGIGDLKMEIESTIDLVPNSLLQTDTKVVYLSSGAVYGECLSPKSEIDPVYPITAYGKLKVMAEKKFEDIFSGRFTSLRIGNVIDRENPYGILSLARTAKRAGSLDLFGNPYDCRDYVDVEDLNLMVSTIIESRLEGNVFNLGSGISISLEDFEAALLNILPNLAINWNPPRESDLSRTQLDVSKICISTGISTVDPKITLNAFLRDEH